MKSPFILVYCTAFMLVFLACSKDKACPNAEKAKFEDHTGFDGCKMMLKLNDGTLLEPQNLNDFNIELKDGAKLWVEYHEPSFGASICMMGNMVVIDCISER